MTEAYLILVSITLGGLSSLTLILILGRRWNWVARPPAIDLLITLYTVVPWVYGCVAGMRIHGHWSGGLAGLGAVAATQIVALELFDLVHPRLGRRGNAGLQINRTIGGLHGWFRNRASLWLTTPLVPGFLIIRLVQAFGWKVHVALLGFKKFRQSDYITVSRQKIENLVGADFVWCLYCDWMTGQWSLATDMLNFVESFWCPLKFVDKGKCEKCSKFFQMEHWAAPDASAQTMRDVIVSIHQPKS